MTEEEKKLAKKAVADSVNGLKDWILQSFYFAPAERNLVEVMARYQINEGAIALEEICNPKT